MTTPNYHQFVSTFAPAEGTCWKENVDPCKVNKGNKLFHETQWKRAAKAKRTTGKNDGGAAEANRRGNENYNMSRPYPTSPPSPPNPTSPPEEDGDTRNLRKKLKDGALINTK